jgi:A/G-specific adenine glycosylase
MLQQTQVSRVIDRYEQFLARFPTPTSCADAPTSAVIEEWAGLGYNRRAVNLWRTASVVANEHEGELPGDLASLLALPGIGPYTARAILVFAFEQDVAVVDTNVGRLLARWSGEQLAPRQAQTMADALVPSGASWAWNQSLFDFAVAICTKRDPNCGGCPAAAHCAWQGGDDDPAANSAGISGKQSRFDGSERQVRGRIVDALRIGPVPISDLSGFGRDGDTLADVLRIATGLVADGLALHDDNVLLLPSEVE